MKRAQIFLLLVMLLTAALVLILVLRNRQPPRLPQDGDHADFASAERCLTCHGPGGSEPRGPNHPPARECLRCHGR